MGFDTPVALFVFNRPEHTRQVINAISKVKPQNLYVVADGPREGNEDDQVNCEQVRGLIDSIDWSCSITKNYSDTNLGCKLRISSGLDWVFSVNDEAIILEDDILPEPSFFNYCAELLERYRDNERVHLIRGSTLAENQDSPHSYYFSRWYGIWGWASWARAWRHYDLGMEAWPETGKTWLKSFLPEREMVRVMGYLFDEMHAGRIDSWEFPFFFTGWLNDAYAITPKVNMITNIGFGYGATHMTDPNHSSAQMTSQAITFPMIHPEESIVQSSDAADCMEWSLGYPGLKKRLRFMPRFKQKFISLLKQRNKAK